MTGARRGWIALLALACAVVATPVFAQGGSNSTALNGVVQDKDGNVPGATVVLTNVATGEKLPPVLTNSAGGYSFPGLAPGTYKVTITMTGFKTSEVDVRLQSGVATNSITTKLEVGAREEIVTVRGVSDIVRTDTPTVSQTIGADFIQKLPRSDRNALNFLIFLPGVQTIGGAGSARNSQVAGLPDNTINITIDGISNSNLLQSGDGFFSLVVPRLDAVEEVTLTNASAAADSTGQGAVQIRFVTRSGTNKFETSLYLFLQHKLLNSNTYFDRLNGLDRPQRTDFTYGGRIGGPIVLPGFDGRGRMFFFFNQEEVYNPNETIRARTFIRQSALDGTFAYGSTGQFSVNMMAAAQAWAAANTGVIPGVSLAGAQFDPQIKSLLEAIRASATTTGTIEELVTNPNRATLRWPVPVQSLRHSPTVNITANLSPKHRLQGSYYWQRFVTDPDTLNGADPTFPGFPAYGDQTSYRTTASMSLRSTVSTAIVNELRGGWQWSPVGFFTNSNVGMFDNQGGFAIDLGFSLTDASPGDANSPGSRNTANWTVSDQLNWLKGSHSFTMGGDFTRVDDWAKDYNTVPSIDLGFEDDEDPFEAFFSNAANFPNSTTTDRNNARSLFALLTGRVASVQANGALNEAGDQYIYNGATLRRELQDDYSFYAQDVWRWKPTVTVTAGLRYQYQLPMTAKNGIFTTISTEDACGLSGFGSGPGGRFCNMFNPGDIRNPTVTPEYIQYSAKSKGYNTDKNNIAPNVGIAWRPNVQSGFLRKLLGDPELATFSGGYSRSFNRERLDRFLTVFNGNPGQSIPATRSNNSSAFPLVLPGESWPILFSQKNRLGPPAFDPVPAFPIAADFGDGAWIFNPDIEVPYTDSWNVSFQRSVTKDTVVELRYQGNTNRLAWERENWNAINRFETGWLTGRDGVGLPNGEYERAQANLRANVLAGNGQGFRYTGIPGTSPLPIILAHFNGIGCGPGCVPAAANNPASYVGNLWTNGTFVGQLDPFNANPTGFASNLYLATSSAVPSGQGLSTRLFNNAMDAGYPKNFWVLNPQLNTVDVTTNSSNKPYTHQVVLQLRRRLALGLAVQTSYTWTRGFSGSLQDFHLPRFQLRNTGIPHNIQSIWTYDVPVGRGKRFGANMNAFLDAIVGGWAISGTARFQQQSFVLRNAVLEGMTLDEARDALSVIRLVTDPVSGVRTVFNFPLDIYTNTRLAYATDETRPGFYVPGQEPTGPNAIPTAAGTYRYFRPAGEVAGFNGATESCSIIFTGDCGTQELWFNGRWFGEMDFRLAKQFQLPGRARLEFSAEIFNATKAINFPNTINPGFAGNPPTTANNFRMTSTQSGARTAQVVWRISW